eukprot:4757703-Pleurochrysis_carterae.AAC.1
MGEVGGGKDSEAFSRGRGPKKSILPMDQIAACEDPPRRMPVHWQKRGQLPRALESACAGAADRTVVRSSMCARRL